MAGDPHWNSVVLAMHMDGANASTVFTDQKGKPVTAFGNAQISTAQSKFGGASALFDGTGDYLTVPTDSTFDLGSGDFTIDLWVRLSALTSNALMFARRPSVAACGIVLLFDFATSKFTFYAGDTDLAAWNAILIESGTTSVGSWNHFAVVRNGDAWTLYKDGVTAATATASFTVAPSTVPAFIGGSDAIASFFTGNLDDLRITKGVARYTANFTPPAAAFPNAPAMISGTVKDSANAFAPRAVRVYRKSDGALSGAVTSHATTGAFSLPALDASLHYAIAHDSDADPHWESVVLALHMDGANASTVFTDLKGHAVTAVGNAQISTAQSKFGGASALFDGASDGLTVTGVGFEADFTIEAFVWIDSTCTDFLLFAQDVSEAGWVLVPRRSTLGSCLRIYDYTLSAGATSAVPVATNQWVHIAAVRRGALLTAYVNGSSAVSMATATNYAQTSWAIGKTATSYNTTKGYIDDLRITKGVARYQADFTPPERAFSGAMTAGTANALIYDDLTPV